MDDVIDLLAKLDWFETIGALFKMRTPSHRFAVERNCGWSGAQIEAMLKKYGIKVWHRGFTRETLKFRVSKAQASWAEYLLWKNGIPVKGKPVYERNQHYFAPPEKAQPGRPDQARGMGQPRRRDVITEIVDAIWN